MDERATFKGMALAEVNGHILDAARGSVTVAQEWEFFCACGHPDCHEPVLLSVAAYIGLHELGEPVPARGHRVSQIERARRLGARRCAHKPDTNSSARRSAGAPPR